MPDATPIVTTKPGADTRPNPIRFRRPPKRRKAVPPNASNSAADGDAKPEAPASVKPQQVAEAQAEGAPDQAPDDTKSKRAPKRKGKGTKAAKAERDASHLAVVMDAARTAVRTFAKAGVSCTTFGSLACKLYGSARCPKDVDLLVYQPPTEGEPWTAELLKKTLLDFNPKQFYLTMPKDPTAEYRVLWFRQYYLGPGCKVDVLLPGTMHLPNLPPSSAVVIDGIPLVPFSLLLLHKLQGWDDHRIAEEAHKRRKLPQDAGDIKRLLGLEEKVGELGKVKPWGDRTLFTEEFEELTRRRVRDYCEEYPKHVKKWRFLGFEVPDPPPKPEKHEADEGKQEGAEEGEEEEDVELELDEDDDEDEAKAEVREEKLAEQLRETSIAPDA